MPELDGLAVCKILKTNLFTGSIPIVFITAFTQAKVLHQLETFLAEGIIIKPFDPLTLDSQIAKICNGGGREISKI